MPRKGYIQTEAHRRASSLAHLGKPSGMLGKHHSLEAREKQGLGHLGKHPSPATRKKQSLAHLGKPSNRLGKTYEEIYGIEKAAQMRKASSEDHLGEKNPNFGKHFSLATRKKQSFAHLGKHVGEKNCMFGKCGEKNPNFGKRCPDISGPKSHFYRDGRGNEPYGVEFTSALRLKIRKRDDFMCQFPGCGKLENGKAFCVHHIDHNKHNNNPWDLILLDPSHHSIEKIMFKKNPDETMNMFEDVLRARHIII